MTTKSTPAKRTTRPRQPATPKMRTLLVKKQPAPYESVGSEFQITVPASAKITMAHGLNPSTGKYGNVPGGSTPCLRIYEGTKQTACFVGVIEFRDLGYDYVEKVVEVEVEADEREDSRGNSSRSRLVRKDERWERPALIDAGTF